MPQSPQEPPRPMPLLPPEVVAKLPKWRETAEQEDPTASVKWFLPATGWTWYVVEYDGEDTCFGLVAGLDVEAGYFSLSEIESVRSPFGNLPVERDLYFTPAPLSQLRALHEQRAAPRSRPASPRLEM